MSKSRGTTADIEPSMTHDSPTDRRVEAILERVPEGCRVLDVGCVKHNATAAKGDNWLHKHLNTRGDVLGIDHLPGEVAVLQADGWNVRCADAEAFDFDETFDVIVAGELIEHLANPGAFLACAREHLHAEGQLILTTPNPWGACYLKRIFTAGEVHCNEEHTAWFDRRTLRQLLERQGFEVVEHEFIEPPTRRDGHREYLAWWMWHVFETERLGALDHLFVAEPAEGKA